MKMIVAVIQEAVSSNDKATNLALTEKRIRDAAQSGAQLVLLQELHSTLYFCQVQNGNEDHSRCPRHF